jgi:hypothetical protein
MHFKPLTYSQAISTALSTNFIGSDIPHSTLVKDIAIGMIEELITKMSDMDIPDTLYITIHMGDKPYYLQEEHDEKGAWEND